MILNVMTSFWYDIVWRCNNLQCSFDDDDEIFEKIQPTGSRADEGLDIGLILCYADEQRRLLEINSDLLRTGKNTGTAGR